MPDFMVHDEAVGEKDFPPIVLRKYSSGAVVARFVVFESEMIWRVLMEAVPDEGLRPIVL